MAIDCCKGCVPPKRTPTCKFDGTCDRYAKAKEKHDREMAIDRKKRDVEAGLKNQACEGIYRSRKIKRKKKRYF